MLAGLSGEILASRPETLYLGFCDHHEPGGRMTHPEVYAPAEDTWLLLRAAWKECRDGERVLEVGCGSGIISASLSGRASMLATDINPYAVRAARDQGIEVVRAGNLAAGICGRFDLILFNPPYLPTMPESGGTTGSNMPLMVARMVLCHLPVPVRCQEAACPGRAGAPSCLVPDRD